jgi:hypothetical protein
MKTITNLILALALTASMALADDGHTGGGNRCETCPPPCETCLTAPEGTPTVLEEQANEENADESLYEYWKEVLIDFLY